jgi:IPT/TIG domain/Squalene-hopene cyclase C-terminal domain
MIVNRLAASAALAAALTLATLVPAGIAGAASPPTLPQTAAAQSAANWLASLIQSNGSIESTTTPGTADLPSTANAVLALASAGADQTQASAALGFMEDNVNAYVTVDGADGPGQLALLILDAHALGVAPTSFNGTNLVSRLLATQQTTGSEAGLFGVQSADFDGAYRQGLSLAALAAAGVKSGTAVASAESWLTAQQCPDGGWTSLITADNPCNGKPGQYEGPDTNSSALAVEGLEAQGALTAAAAKSAIHFFKTAEDADGGWGYEPNSAHHPGSTDPDSTSLVIQALLALGSPPWSTTFTKSGTDPVASLLADQITSGPGVGGIVYPGISGPNLIATYQSIPALAGVTFAYDIGTPALTKVAPSHGPVAGGTTVHLTGTSLTEVDSVLFGATPASSFTVDSGTSIVAVAPPGSSGTVAVTVVSPAGTSTVTGTTQYTYR